MTERIPRSIGEILSDAVTLLRRHLKPLYLASLPFCALYLVLREAGETVQGTLMQKLADPTHLDGDAIPAIMASGAAGLGLQIGAVIVVQLLSVGVVAMVASAWKGRAPTIGEATSAILFRGAPFLFSMLLFLVAFFAAVAVPALVVGGGGFAIGGPAVGAVLGALVAGGLLVMAGVFFTLRWGLVSQTVVLEGKSGPAALARSSALMAGRGLPFFEGAKFRFSVLYLAAFALTGVLQSLFVGPRLVLAVLSGWNFSEGMPPLTALPLWGGIPFALLEVVTDALVFPFASVLLTLFYFDLRVRYEALDLDDDAP